MARSDWGKRPGLVLDTGALIELQKRGSNLFAELQKAQQTDLAILVPAPVLVEWLAGGETANMNRVLDLVDVVELDEKIAKAAGKALVGAAHPSCKTCGVRGGPSVADAVVMAIADEAGDTVLTSDPKDLNLLRSSFRTPNVRSW
jgi:predicted nucleic acid-binding protein